MIATQLVASLPNRFASVAPTEAQPLLGFLPQAVRVDPANHPVRCALWVVY